MAKKISAKQGKDFFDTRSGRVLADSNFAQQSSANHKTEIGFIREAFPLRSKDDITLVLQSCDYNVEAAIASFTNGEADNLLKEWNTQGRKSKNAKKKRNKKKQAKGGEPESTEVAVIPQNSEKNDINLKQSNSKDAKVTAEENLKKPLSAATISLECPAPSPGLLLLQPPSPSSSDISLPSSNSDQPTDAAQDAEPSSKNSQGTPSHKSSANAKFERMTSTGPDALKKTVKDLQRSSVSLPRFQLLLEEECDKSFKIITGTFQELRQCLNDREAHLLAQMEEFKKQAVELLEQRQENAAALKLKSDRVGGMQEAQVSQLRNEIKNFVTERKIDEELARTTRFVGDKDQLLSTIGNFGEVVPIKSCYSPVTLNPPAPPSKKVERSNADKKAPETVSSAAKTITSSASTSVSVPAITAPNDENSSHKALQEVAELHAKLQAALQEQGLSSSPGKHVEGQKQSKPDHKNVRPNSASQAPRQQQTSRRPQTALPQSQQQRRDRKESGNQQRERTRPNRPAEPRASQQDQQNSNQSSRNSRRSNQRRPPQRNPKSEISNEKNEVPNSEASHSPLNSGDAQQESKPDKDKQSQSNPEKVMPQQSQTVKEHAQSGNRNRSLQEQREGGDERPRNRNRRRGGRRGGPEGHNTASDRAHFKGPGEESENGPSNKAPLEKEEVKTAVCEEKKHDIKKNSNKENGPVGSTSTLEDPAVNGHKTDISSNSADCLNGENAHVLEKKEGVNKEALPQRPDRPSRRRGAQRDRKDEPRSGPAPDKHLNGTKPVENGTEECDSKEESTAESKMQKSTENAENQKETEKENYAAQELESNLDKTVPPRVNGYIPIKEIQEVSIGR
ncbi:uncharacterized protein LOC144631098 [Oculina patagonica]